MKIKSSLKKISTKINSTLKQAGYEIRSTTGGWHLHKGNIYCGNLSFQPVRGWTGSALHHLPGELIDQLKKLVK